MEMLGHGTGTAAVAGGKKARREFGAEGALSRQAVVVPERREATERPWLDQTTGSTSWPQDRQWLSHSPRNRLSWLFSSGWCIAALG